tara:strand:- start:627 stop:1094 length:468 start_codon:yes stop_codon:yes gene_type:complete
MILGLDCSSRAIHGAVVDENENLVMQFRTEKPDNKAEFNTRFLNIVDNFAKILSKINIEKAFVEAAIYIQNPKSTIEIARVVGGVQITCHKNRVPCQLVDNTKWKKEIVGKGNCSKTQIMEFAVDKWGDVFLEQDYADAACIALYGLKESRDGDS